MGSPKYISRSPKSKEMSVAFKNTVLSLGIGALAVTGMTASAQAYEAGEGIGESLTVVIREAGESEFTEQTHASENPESAYPGVALGR